jgi:hypothetical protein
VINFLNKFKNNLKIKRKVLYINEKKELIFLEIFIKKIKIKKIKFIVIIYV